MPCPYFEPRELSRKGFSKARLPLIHEYEGMCHACAGQPAAAPLEMIGGPCNHGCSRGPCSHYPVDTKASAMRYSVVRQSEKLLELVCIEEVEYVPVRWYVLQYSQAGGLLEPNPAGDCIRAQAVAFCRSYLERPRLRPFDTSDVVHQRS